MISLSVTLFKFFCVKKKNYFSIILPRVLCNRPQEDVLKNQHQMYKRFPYFFYTFKHSESANVTGTHLTYHPRLSRFFYRQAVDRSLCATSLE